MHEPLFDGVTAVAVLLGVGAVFTLHADDLQKTDAERAPRRRHIGLLLLMLSVGALLSRWIESVMALPPVLRPPVGRQGMLSAVCGFGIAAAVLSVTASTAAARAKSFLAVVASGVLALVVAAAWKWALLLWIALLLGGACAAIVSFRRASWRAGAVRPLMAANQEGTLSRDQAHQGADAPRSPISPSREPVLVLITAVALLLLLLGTWQHVVARESQRTTRSPRFSAWPRATALQDAWERTGWTAKADDQNSEQANAAAVQRVSDVAAREQKIAWGLGALLLVVVGAAWQRSSGNEPFDAKSNLSTEVSHVS